MMAPRYTLSRADFLKWLGVAAANVSVLGPRAFIQPASDDRQQSEDEFIEKLFAEALVFDGAGSRGVNRGKEWVSLAPGAIKRLTGIDMGTQTVHVPRLEGEAAWLEEHSDAFARIERASDIGRLSGGDKYGILYYTQRAFDLGGSVEPLARWKELGLRSLQITYADNELGGGSRSDDTPLSPLGEQVVKELNRLRMVVDVSHCGRRTTLDTCEASSAPVTANHANALRLAPHSRNKSDEELRAIAGTGGVVGAVTIGRFLQKDLSRPATIDDFVEQIEYMVQLIGIDHVGIASDASMDGTQVYEVDYSDPFLNSYDRWKHVVRRLHQRGYSREALEKILGLNFKRVFEQVLDP